MTRKGGLSQCETCKKKLTGRPIKYDRFEIAKDLITWAKKDNSMNLNAFCVNYDPKINPQYLYEWARDLREFSDALKIAKGYLAVRREEQLSKFKLHVKAYDNNATVYDFFLREQRLKEKRFEHKLRRESSESQTKDLCTLVKEIKNNEIKQEADEADESL